MADAWGIEHEYVDASGRRHRVDAAVVERLRSLIGAEPAGPPPVVVTRPDRHAEVGRGRLVLEDGTETTVEGSLPGDLPLGYHLFHGEAPSGPGNAGRADAPAVQRVIVSPGQCHLPAGGQRWGWAAQLYATRSTESWGMGDLADLRRLVRWSAGHGAGFAMLNPLHAVAPTDDQQPSPYFPATRRFLNPIYLRVEEVPGADSLAGALEPLRAAGRALNHDRRLDRNAVWTAKRHALATIWAERAPGESFERWLAQQRRFDDSLWTFATWCVLSEDLGADWRQWPAAYADPSGPAVAQVAQEREDRVRFYAWLQWLTQAQVAASAAHMTLIQDMPIGVDPGGADAWMWQGIVAAGASVGAPPDEYNTRGQDWGLPPFVPWQLRAHGYQPFVDTIRATLSTGGGLRIDHVMGLFRLWWIPQGASAADGAYVRYRASDLLDIVALESHRAQAVVVGEDLGTVEDTARRALAEANVLSYRLLWFEDDPPARWPANAMAAVTTHDLPTVAGLWSGRDLAAQRRLGLDPNEEGTEGIRRRLGERGGLPDDAPVAESVRSAYRLLGQSPSRLLTATLDDALGEPERPNIPGADGLRPNWSLALPVPLEELEQAPLAFDIAESLSHTDPNDLRAENDSARISI